METFFKMLKIIQWFLATGGASIKKKIAESHSEQDYEPNVCFLPKFLCWVTNLQHDVIWRWGIWWATGIGWGQGGGALMMRLLSLQEVILESSFCLFLVRYSKNWPSASQEEGPHQELIQSAPRFLTSLITVKNNCLVKSHILWYFAIISQGDKDKQGALKRQNHC